MLDHRRGPAPASSVGPQLLRGMISGRRSTHFRPPRANHTRIDTLIHNDSVAHREHVNGYIQHVLAHSTPSSVVAQPERPASAGSSSSETDVEVEELQQTISQLQEANEALQAEMQRVVHGLQELAEGAKRSHHSLRRASSALGTQVSPATPSLHVPLASGDNLTCVLQHPLCCTTTTVHEDVANQTATVTMQTTARATEGAAAKGMLTMEDLTALGTQALVGAAAEQLRTRAREVRSRSLGADIQRLHSELCRILRTGNIVHAQRNPVVSEFGHGTLRVSEICVLSANGILFLFQMHHTHRIFLCIKPHSLLLITFQNTL